METTTAPALTSPKLEELKVLFAAAWTAMLTHTDPFAKETKDAKLAVFKLEGEIKAEESMIQKAQNEAKTAEARNARLALNQRQIDALTALIAVKGDKKAAPEAIQAATDEFNTAKEAVDNELLAKFAGSSSAKKAAPTNGEDKSTHASDQSAAIVELFLAGKTHKEIEDLGYKRSTVWHAINNHKKANSVPA